MKALPAKAVARVSAVWQAMLSVWRAPVAPADTNVIDPMAGAKKLSTQEEEPKKAPQLSSEAKPKRAAAAQAAKLGRKRP